MDADANRRAFLQGAVVLGAGSLLSACASAKKRAERERAEMGEQEEEVAPAEDLMREHGVLKRILLVYQEAIRRLETTEEVPPEPIVDAATIIHVFIEDYHEKLEENYLFPRFRKANVQVELVDVLEKQHNAGRKVTERTLALANYHALRDPQDRRRMVDLLQLFIRMYEPHEAREDTVLFPALRRIVSPHEYAALGEQFEDEEHKRFGEDGFEKMVDRVAGIEKELGIYDLRQFTPEA